MPLHLVSNGQLSDASDVDQYYQLYNGGLTYDVKNVFNAKGDAQTVSDGAMTATSTTLTCATSAPFVSTDVGKLINVGSAGAVGSNPPLAATLSTTITGYISATQVTIGTAATTTVSGATANFGSNDLVPIQNAIAAASSSIPTLGGIVYFPAGLYMFNARIVVGSSNVTLRGAGKGLVTLIASGFGGQPAIQFLGAAATTPILNCAIEDLTIDGANRGTLTHLNCQWFDHFAVRRVKFTNSFNRFFQIGIPNDQIENYQLTFEDCDFTKHSNTLFETVMISVTQDVNFRRCLWDTWQYAAVSLYEWAKDVSFQDCIIRNSSGTLSRAVIYKLSDSHLKFDNCRFENLTGKGLESDGQVGSDLFGATTISHLIVTRCYFNNCVLGIELGSVTNFTVSDNLIENCLRQGIVLGAGSFANMHGVLRGNTIRNNGAAQTTLQYGLDFQTGTAYVPDCDIDVVDNHIYDDQAVATQLVAIHFGLLISTRTADGIRFRGNYLECPTILQVGTGRLGPNSSFKDNDGYNPVGRLTPPSLSASGLPLTNPFNVDVQLIVTGGTVTEVDIGAMAAPTLGPQIIDGGAAASALGAGSFSLVQTLLTSAGETQASPATSVTLASGDKISVAGVTPPTVAPTITEHMGQGTTALIAGSYTFSYTWTNAVGETTASPATTLTLGTDGHKFDLAQITPPPGAVTARFYLTAWTVQAPITTTLATTGGTKTVSFSSPPAGYVNGDSFTLDTAGNLETLVISSGAGQNSTNTTLSAAITTTGQTSISVASASGFPGGSTQYMINIDGEHMLVTGGQGTTTWTVTRARDGTTAATHLNAAIVTGGNTATWTTVGNLLSSHSAGAQVAHMRTMAAGLVDEFGLQNNPAVIQAANLNQLAYSAALPPSTSTAGIAVPTGVTSSKFYFSAVPSGTSGFIVSKTPVNGAIVPFDISIQGSGVAAPSVNTSGTNLGLLPPFSLLLPVGQSLVFTYSSAPTHLWFGN